MYKLPGKLIRFKLSIAIPLAILLMHTFATAVFAHHAEIEAVSTCLATGDNRVDYVVRSWTGSGSAGLHNNVTVQYILDNGQTFNLPTGAFTDANQRQFSGSFVVDGAIAGGWIKADPVGPWGSGVNYDSSDPNGDARSTRFVGASHCKIDDFGDAPESYGDAYHEIVPYMTIGEIVDAEGGSQYSSGADGDDLNAQNGEADDEDGVVFVNGVGAPGSTNNQLQVSVFNHKLTRVNHTVGDKFGEVSYSKNNGTNTWLGEWRESEDPNGSASGGRIHINNGKLYLNDSPDTGQTPEIQRCVDLSNSWSATLTFDYSTPDTLETEDRIAVSVWTPYTGWETLWTFSGRENGQFDADISNYISNNTCIKFEVTQGYGASNEYFAVDNVQIKYSQLENTGAKVYLSGWIDFNGNGVFDSTEKVINDLEINNSAQLQNVTLPYTVPVDAVSGQTYARFRLSCEMGTQPTGAAGADVGEVEDYVVTIPQVPTPTPTNTPVPPTPTLTSTPVPPTNTPTSTAAPPTATLTNTPAAPTATQTPAEPTLTATPPSGATPTNTATPLSSLGDRVWKDLNRNGIQDADEHGVPGVQVKLWADNDNNGTPDTQIAETLTDQNGLYLFDNLDPSTTYIVQFVVPDDCDVTTPNQGSDDADSDVNPATGLTPPVKLMPGEHNDTIDAGLTPVRATASIGNYVWLDVNKDGKQDSGEAGIQDVTVTLYDNNGQVVGTQQTDANGQYLFIDLTPGSYSLCFALPAAEYTMSPQDNTDNDLDDSDADPDTGCTVMTELVAGENDLSWDAGIYGVPNLAVDKTPNIQLAQPGSVIVYAISYSNNGQVDATDVVIHETVPASTVFLPENSSAGWVCENGAVTAGTKCTYAIGDLPAGGASTEQLSFVVLIDSFLSTEITSVDNVILISGGGGIQGQAPKEVKVPLSKPTSIDENGEPLNNRIFIPLVQTRSGFKTPPGVILTLDQRMLRLGCTLFESLAVAQPALTNHNMVQQFSQLCPE